MKKINNNEIPKKCCEGRTGTGLFIPAGLFIGMGAGFVYNNIPAGLFGGLGLGFLLFAIAKMMCK